MLVEELTKKVQSLIKRDSAIMWAYLIALNRYSRSGFCPVNSPDLRYRRFECTLKRCSDWRYYYKYSASASSIAFNITKLLKVAPVTVSTFRL